MCSSDLSGAILGNGSLVLKVYYNRNSYEVTFNKQGGEGGADQISVVYESTIEALTTLPTLKGHTFAGYYTNTNIESECYFDKEGNVAEGKTKWTITKALELYANWKAITYTVTLDASTNDGTITGTTDKVASFTVTYGETYDGLDGLTATKRGYIFNGWFTDAETGKGTQIKSTDKVEITADQTLYC